MIHNKTLPANIEQRVDTLGEALSGCGGVLFAYVFGSGAVGRLTPLSDVDVAVYLDASRDMAEEAARLLRLVTAHLGTDEIDLIVLNTAPTALLGRLLQTRRVIYEREPLLRHQFESRAIREFSAHQAAEKALKGLHLHLGQEAWGHVCARLLQELPAGVKVAEGLVDKARVLDTFYIPSRDPNSHPEGAPYEHYGSLQSGEAITYAREIVEFVRAQLA